MALEFKCPLKTQLKKIAGRFLLATLIFSIVIQLLKSLDHLLAELSDASPDSN